MIHISDLSWTKKVKHPSEFTQIGADIEVQVLEIDKGNRRLSLGHKQLEENPWDVFETVFTVGSVHEGTIIEMLDKGAVVALPYGVEGFATPKHLVKEDGSQAQLDEKLEFKVIEFNKDAKRIILSHSRIFEDVAKAEERAEKKAASGAKKASSGKQERRFSDDPEPGCFNYSGRHRRSGCIERTVGRKEIIRTEYFPDEGAPGWGRLFLFTTDLRNEDKREFNSDIRTKE